MNHEYDDFLEAQCAADEAKGRNISIIQLIKALREHAPMGLKESKDIVEDFLARRSPAAHTVITDYDAWLTRQIAAIEAQEEQPYRIQLIKLLRDETDLGLRDAKDIVDAYCNSKRPDITTASSLDAAKSDVFISVAKMLGRE